MHMPVRIESFVDKSLWEGFVKNKPEQKEQMESLISLLEPIGSVLEVEKAKKVLIEILEMAVKYQNFQVSHENIESDPIDAFKRIISAWMRLPENIEENQHSLTFLYEQAFKARGFQIAQWLVLEGLSYGSDKEVKREWRKARFKYFFEDNIGVDSLEKDKEKEWVKNQSADLFEMDESEWGREAIESWVESAKVNGEVHGVFAKIYMPNFEKNVKKRIDFCKTIIEKNAHHPLPLMTWVTLYVLSQSVESSEKERLVRDLNRLTGLIVDNRYKDIESAFQVQKCMVDDVVQMSKKGHKWLTEVHLPRASETAKTEGLDFKFMAVMMRAVAGVNRTLTVLNELREQHQIEVHMSEKVNELGLIMINQNPGWKPPSQQLEQLFSLNASIVKEIKESNEMVFTQSSNSFLFFSLRRDVNNKEDKVHNQKVIEQLAHVDLGSVHWAEYVLDLYPMFRDAWLEANLNQKLILPDMNKKSEQTLSIPRF